MDMPKQRVETQIQLMLKRVYTLNFFLFYLLLNLRKTVLVFTADPYPK